MFSGRFLTLEQLPTQDLYKVQWAHCTSPKQEGSSNRVLVGGYKKSPTKIWSETKLSFRETKKNPQQNCHLNLELEYFVQWRFLFVFPYNQQVFIGKYFYLVFSTIMMSVCLSYLVECVLRRPFKWTYRTNARITFSLGSVEITISSSEPSGGQREKDLAFKTCHLRMSRWKCERLTLLHCNRRPSIVAMLARVRCSGARSSRTWSLNGMLRSKSASRSTSSLRTVLK